MSAEKSNPPSIRLTLAPLVSQVCNRLGIQHVLDFHCGDTPIMSALRVNHKMKIQCYDPKVERFKEAPLASELVFCAPVEASDEMIAEAESLTRAVCVFALETSDCEAWLLKLMDKFEVQTYQRIDGGFYVIGYCKLNVKIEVPDGDIQLQ